MCNALFVSAVHIYTFNNIILACDKGENEKCFSVKGIIKSEYRKNLCILFAQILSRSRACKKWIHYSL